ncbi:TetR/AcrR family transcriptional regulator [Rhodovarius crocodyli]|uniref:TetR/AcrR family transcriptional regulator n=1 Tax=Rhodovarius crocodyli TaxID=1979269 RepID=A0A437MD81_9PROT|nr:TetR/AcrR family transcriptional regulator [Rhodovarius crocodyli]RVT95602.1 TetR/AcrR family transcriptional regulator [Rhodovarius crocodyli]
MTSARASIGNTRNPETHAAILDAAEALLAEHGYAGVSMEAVARRAGAGKPTLYRWWPSKAALLMEVYERQKSLALAELEPGACAQDDLTEFVTSMIRFWRETPAGQAFRSIVAEAQAEPAALRLLRDEMLARGRANAAAIIHRAAETGEIAPHPDAEAMMDMIFGAAWYRLLTHRLRGTAEEMPRIVAAAFAAARPGGPLALPG